MVIGNIFFQSLRLMKAAKPSAHNRFFPHNCLKIYLSQLTLDISRIHSELFSLNRSLEEFLKVL